MTYHATDVKHLPKPLLFSESQLNRWCILSFVIGIVAGACITASILLARFA